jgi:lysophospholipase L1-like esterase
MRILILILLGALTECVGQVRAVTIGQNNSHFDPATLSGQVLIWDATDPAARIIDGSSNVQQLTDKSGNGNHMIPASAGVRPPFSSSGGANNLPYVTAASGKTFALNPLIGITSTPATIYIAFKYSATPPVNGRLIQTGASTSGYFYQDGGTPASRQGLFYNSEASPFFSNVEYLTRRTEWQYVTIVLKDVNSNWIEINDEPIPLTMDLSGSVSFGVTRVSFQNITDTRVSEVRVFNRLLTSTEDQNMKAYFSRKYSPSIPALECIFLGDSHTVGVMSGTTTLGPYVSRIISNGVKVVNAGTSGTVVNNGTNAQGGTSNLEDRYVLYNKSKYANCYAIFQYGTNDAALFGATGFPTPSQIKAYYKSYIESFQAAGFPNSKIIVCTPPFSTGSYVRPGGNTTVFPNFAQDARDICTETGVTLCDFYQAMVDAGQDCNTVVGGDLIHGDNAIHTTLYDTLLPLLN